MYTSQDGPRFVKDNKEIKYVIRSSEKHGNEFLSPVMITPMWSNTRNKSNKATMNCTFSDNRRQIEHLSNYEIIFMTFYPGNTISLQADFEQAILTADNCNKQLIHDVSVKV